MATLALSLVVFGLGAARIAAGSEEAKTTVSLNGETVPPSFGTAAGFWLFAKTETPQVAFMGHPADHAVVSLGAKDRVVFSVPLRSGANISEVGVRVGWIGETRGPLKIRIHDLAKDIGAESSEGESQVVSLTGPMPERIEILLETSGKPVAVRLEPFVRSQSQAARAMSLDPVRRPMDGGPIQSSPRLAPVIESALIEWDWRMHDGIGTPREPVSFRDAVAEVLRRGDLLADDLVERGLLQEKDVAAWRGLRKEYHEVWQRKIPETDPAWEALWRKAHQAKRELAFANPLFDIGPLLFCKSAPSCFTHQLAQYLGWAARPGGGLFVLEEPGKSMRTRCLTGAIEPGAYLKPEVSRDGNTIYFSYCKVHETPTVSAGPNMAKRYYHVYSMKVDGSDVRQLTDGPFDDILPAQMPDGSLIFSSTRRGGYHRCGPQARKAYVLTAAEADGSNVRPISFHETNEWDPVVLHDGRVVYTRWDYVDRDAVYYQHLWSIRPDGSDVRIFYGNNTMNPLGTWETRTIPGSNKVMATGSSHHAMSAGSIVLIDPTRGVDGPEAMWRLTPDALFPESEVPLSADGGCARFDSPVSRHFGMATRSPHRQTTLPVAQRRWPGHCYRSPWPLSEDYFLAAYSYDLLRGEMSANIPNMFGLYLVDSFGNRELIYRDPNIGSQWPIPLAPRPTPPRLPTMLADSSTDTTANTPRPGVFALQNVYESWPKTLDDKVTHLRIIQLLPKSTPVMDDPPMGIRGVPGIQVIGAAPGKQVLGTVPVEEDGSAYFEVPSKTPLMFQALDAKGRAIQTMRSITYVQPGEVSSCVGCHESRTSPPLPTASWKASARAPSKITPGPSGSKPFSYPLLVQPVLDRHCVECHNPKKPEGKIVLTSSNAGNYTQSYNALVPYLSLSAWGMPHGNHEPMTMPDRFGARASRLIKLLDKGHYDVKLPAEDWERLVTWIDANGLFYGTYDREDQARQRRGLVIEGPDLE